MTKKCSNKECRRAGELLLLSEFPIATREKDGYSCWCKKCNSAASKKYHKEHKAKHSIASKEFREKHPGYIPPCRTENPDYFSKWREKNPDYIQPSIIENPNYMKAVHESFLEKHPGYMNEYMKNKRKTVPQFAMALRLRALTTKAIKKQGGYKSGKTRKLLGCAYERFMIYWKFMLYISGMTMEDFMGGRVHTDHIRPCSSFDLTDLEQQKECFNYKNLQPLWARDNIKKGNRI